jgi:hypothetical protein
MEAPLDSFQRIKKLAKERAFIEKYKAKIEKLGLNNLVKTT